jgi:hypothetical protein
VTSENGNIHPGDSLTASSIPGVLRKANSGESTVGIALEASNQSQDTVQVMISRKNKSLSVSEVEQQVTERIAQMEIEDEVNLLVSEAINSLEIDELVVGLEERVVVLEDLLANDQAQIISNHSNQIQILNDQMTNVSERLTSSENQLTELTLTVEGLNETDSLIITKLTDHESRISLLEESLANVKAQINPNYSNEIQMSNDLISNSVVSLGEVLVSNEDEAGNQIFTLSADLELVNLTANRVKTDALETNKLELGLDISGRGVIEAGEVETTIETKEVFTDSKIYITPAGNTFGEVLYYDEVVEGESFKVKIEKEIGENINFNWLIVE